VISQMDSGDHTIFLGEVLRGKVIASGRGMRFDLRDYLNASASPDGP
jgi:flavin reductase (DIM6/NTAB) family NADH-FMN oxidoreductase RutF